MALATALALRTNEYDIKHDSLMEDVENTVESLSAYPGGTSITILLAQHVPKASDKMEPGGSHLIGLTAPAFVDE